MADSSKPIPIVLVGKSAEIGRPFSELLKPEYEVIYFIQSLEAAQKELPLLVSGQQPTNLAPNDVGSNNFSQPPRAVFWGRAFQLPDVKEVMAASKSREPVAWIAGDPANMYGEKPPPGFAETAAAEAKEVLAGWFAEVQSENKLLLC